MRVLSVLIIFEEEFGLGLKFENVEYKGDNMEYIF